MSKKFVVGLYSNFTGNILMDEVIALTDVSAGKIFLMNSGEGHDAIDLATIQTMEELKQYVFDQDHSIEVFEIERNNWKRYSNDA